ncbi:MAG: glycosyltransferase [Solirubrobacteraceae bacterium]
MNVAVVAEFYPRARDPVLGIWAHRQALAARAAGAEVRVLVLHRPIPPAAALAARDRRAIGAGLRQPSRARIDGLEVRYVPFLSPPRGRTYGQWGAWAAPPLAAALRALRRSFPFDVVHAHYAVPAGEAVRLARIGTPCVISEHGGDVFYTAPRSAAGRAAVERAFGHARLVLANSAGIAARCRELGADATRVVHLGTDVPAEPAAAPASPLLVTVAHLVARKRHADVIRALWLLRDRHPELRYEIVGDGPERAALAGLAAELGVSGRVAFRGQLPPDAAVAAGRAATAFVMPSIDEAFGVAYVEAMAAGVPAVAALGEDGPAEIAAAGGGIELVPPGDVEALAARIDALVADPDWRARLGEQARATVTSAFTWERCGRATVEAYASALEPPGTRAR